MKREYTLLILGALTASIPWLAFTPSLNRILFTIIGFLLIIIAYRYRSEKISGKIQVTKTEPIVNMPEPLTETVPQKELESNSQTYERKQQTRI